uniref:Opioid growth factor receptor n=1 Tax=Marseillevirus LCMAC202 TaxID=2506606 RepID=A0A481YX38_9VIRU|nr:MAG: opioid growth factor receptor [Marseillevirus LCMAC202]
MNTVKFYNHQIPSLSGYWLKDIWTWDKVTLEQKHDFIQSLFPLWTPGVAKAYLLTPQAVNAFKSDPKLLQNVLHSLIIMLNFYGLQITPDGTDVQRITPSYQVIDGITVGLYATHNYRRIARMLQFLRIIGQEYLAQLLFLGICRDLRADLKLRQLVNASGSLKVWMNIMGLPTVGYDPDQMKKYG